MAGKIGRLFKRTFIPLRPEDSPRTAINWLILFLPLVGIGLWHSSYQVWLWMVSAALWSFNITWSFINRTYFQMYKLQEANLQQMMVEIQAAYNLVHEHCPNCGRRLTPPKEMVQ
jgi:hypothetical protein